MDRTGDFGSVRLMCHLPRFGPGPRLCGTPRQLTDQPTNREADYTLNGGFSSKAAFCQAQPRGRRGWSLGSPREPEIVWMLGTSLALISLFSPIDGR